MTPSSSLVHAIPLGTLELGGPERLLLSASAYSLGVPSSSLSTQEPI